MTRQTQLRWSQVKIGLLVLVALTILVAMIMNLEEGLGLLSRQSKFRAVVSHTQGLKVGGPVRMNGVDIGSSPAPCRSSPSRRQISCDRVRQTMPQPLRIIKLIASGVAFSAGMMRSPSFSRFSSSTRTIIRPARNSEIASSIVQNITNPRLPRSASTIIVRPALASR